MNLLSFKFNYLSATLCKFFIVLSLLTISSFSAALQPSNTLLEDYFQETWTTRDGLPHNTINSITQSDDGYIWIATWEGLARFNGRKFELFGRGEETGLPDSGIRSLSKTLNKGILVTAARGGVARINKGAWQSWQPFGVLINTAVEDKTGTLWLASEGKGLFRQLPNGERQQFTTEHGLPSNVVHSLMLDAKQQLWVGTGRGLALLNIESKQIKFNVFPELISLPVFVIKQQRNRMLVGTEQGLFTIENGKVAFLDSTLQQLAVSALSVSGDVIWIGTTDTGLYKFTNQKLEQLSIAQGLPNNRILSIYQDREQSVWIGTNGGLFRLRDAPFITYTADKGLAGDYIRSVISHSDGSIWVGSSQGISKVKGSNFTNLDLTSHSSAQSVLSLTEDPDGSTWIGTYTDGLLRWKNNKVIDSYSRSSGLAANEVRAILKAQDGSLWVGTAQGLNHITATGIATIGTADGLAAPFVIALYQHSDQRIFVGTGAGLSIINPDASIEQIDLSHLDGAEYVFGFSYDKLANILWITTDRGLIAYYFNAAKAKIIGRNAGLPVDKLFQLVIDNKHNFWLTSNRGVLRVSRQNVMAFLDNRLAKLPYELFGESDGMQSAQANGGSMPTAALDSEGRVWIATSKGVSVVDPELLARFSTNILPVVIEGIKVDGAAVKQGDNLLIKAGTSRIELQFAGLGYVMAQRILYRTKLVGFDSDWVQRDSNNNAEYTNLAPGDYQFKVSASYPQGKWSDAEASINFTIEPYYWQRPLFWLFILVVMTLLIVLLIRWRLAILKQREALLKAQVQEKTLALQLQADNLQKVDKERSELLVQLKHQAESFEIQARLDVLTNLANRRAFDEALAQECARAKRTGQPLSMVLLDIDYFKLVNDQYSHSVGDQVLVLVAAEINQYCREVDTVARWGGEEFAILLPQTKLTDAVALCERIRLAIMQIDCSDIAENLQVTISLGVAEYRQNQPYNKLLSSCDTALYKAKQNGRNRVEVSQSLIG
ncbi:diguanylate cyclase [Rheinheimera sp. MMS21-TC3]|uniref:diguanylate cyclase n=1 Tax=Rheinheimera sp. MMS21-TC3 TaxID=3072790 RepID=UPI0028C483A7|nr:diguanylate cyclase [Rheinheimera sp. MMS21-TC3]WNO60479.1 diguanylate cyclase [Rheinheimera sp. MMS21-TC3]